MKFQHILDKVIGSEIRFSLEDRILNAALLLTIIVGIITSTNTWIQSNHLHPKFISSLIVLINLALYLLAIRKSNNNWIKITYIFLLFLAVNYVWYSYDGISGTVGIFIIGFIFLVAFLTKGYVRWLILATFFTVSIFIFYFEASHPDFVMQYRNEREENWDTYISTFAISIGIILLNLLIINTYKRKNREIEELNRTKDTFISIIAHDLKNPIGTLSSLGEYIMLNDEYNNPEERKKLEHAIYTSSKQTYSLLENILLWARSETGMIMPEIQNIEIRNSLNDSIFLLEAQAHSKDISIVNDAEEGMYAKADPNMFNLIIRNLLSNAIKFTNRRGNITLFTSHVQRSNVVTIGVKDTGIGLEAKLIPTIFNLDSSMQSLGTQKETGTGLGLKLCKEFTDKLSGRIWVESEKGKGSTFFISLPV
ncbi:sensor histidine kinase [Bacteroidota bacterium]